MIESIVGAEYDDADAVVIGAPYEHTASFKTGAIKAPDKIREVLDSQLELFDRYSKTVPCQDYKFAFQMIDYISRMAPENMVEKIEKFLSVEDRFFVLVGGVHSVSIGAFQALSKKHNPEDVTIVQIDAHFDLRDDDSEYNEINPSKYAHSTVMRRAHEMGYTILPIGVRTMYSGEYEYVKKHNIKFFEWGRTSIDKPTVEEVIASIPTDKVYLTVDVDGFDPSVMPATGTPAPGGLSWEYGVTLIRTLMKEKDVISADVVEVAPVESSVLTEYAAAQLIYHILALHGQKNLSK